jgi:hypothetical protein
MLVYLFVVNNSREKKSWFLSILFAEYCGRSLQDRHLVPEEEIVQETSDPDGGIEMKLPSLTRH